MKSAPVLAQLAFWSFVWIFVMAVTHVTLDLVGVWSTLPQGLTHGADLLTGAVLFATLLMHLAMIFGQAPKPPA
jgi:hypothetical protein